MYPESFFHTISKRIKKEWRFAFCCAFLSGLLIHLYRLTNHLLTWDSVYNFYDSQNKIEHGRWFLSIGCGISSYYDIQWIIGLLSVSYLGLVCVCLVEIFSVKQKISIFLLCALTVSFPSVAGTFAYMYTADGYFISMLFSACAVLVTLKYKRGWIFGLLLLALSYGSYQAYVSYAVMIILVWSLLQLLFEKISVKKLLYHWRHFLYMGIGGTLLYFVCNKILTCAQHARTSAYNGISEMALPNGGQLVCAVSNCLIDFAYFFFGPLHKINLYQILNADMLLLLAALIVWIVWKNRICRSRSSLLLILLCLAAMPFACSMIYFLSSQVRYYMLMYAGFSLIYLLPLLLYENISLGADAAVPASPDSGPVHAGRHGKQTLALFLCWACVIITALNGFHFALLDNISYLYMTTSNQKTFELTERVVDRIEQTEGFENAKKLCVIGHFDGFDAISLNLPPQMAGVRDSYLISEQTHFAAMMNTYFGLSLDSCSDKEKEAIQNSAAFAEMKSWPQPGCVTVLNDTVVIKIAGPDN